MRATPFKHEELEALVRHGGMESLLAQEVIYQRQWMARVARIIEVQALDMPKLAKCRREALEGTVLNIRDLVCGRNVAHIPFRLASEYNELVAEAP